ncbi:MAG TPA: cobyrinate a,c-diamide synthase [Methanomassiliicoccales archaeon]|nr:cobyrinate a,c-diamide synthase [Methanomassiliicoccales archaeon]
MAEAPRVVIAGERSGTGKSTVTIGLLMALRRKGLRVQPFKVGPDFLDPMHHTRAAGRPSRNLDTWMFPSYVPQAFANGMRGADMGVIEGVMGMHDGLDGRSEEGSTAHLAKTLRAPVVLVLDARASARSLGAVALGLQAYDPEVTVAGVIFNNVAGGRHLETLEDALRGEIPCLGGIPSAEDMGLESRHLGLVPAGEVRDEGRYEAIRRTVEGNVDMDALRAVAEAAPPLELPPPLPLDAPVRAKVGVAMDEAFNFYYQDNLDLLRAHGAEVVPFSPLRDSLPAVDGLYFGGGYPELFAEGLQANEGMREAVRAFAEDRPVYAECGGLMYACSELVDLEGRRWRMSGLFDAEVTMAPRLEALGYVEVRMVRDCLLGRAGTVVRGHVFHYSRVTRAGGAFAYDLGKAKGIAGAADGLVRGNALASYAHLHFGTDPALADNLVTACARHP